ncbi:MAG: hypothetical protein HFJ03_13600 [Lachnospira sp.]|nr:hypothetical protein [Lachnospira sp.]
MGVINAFQSILILFLYTFVVVIIPSLILGKRFANRRFVHRFMIYLTVGNIYIINIVFLLQLMKISNKTTLILASFGVELIIYVIIKRKKIGTGIVNIFDVLDKHVRGTLGAKSLKTIIWSALKKIIIAYAKKIWKFIKTYNIELIFSTLLVLIISYFYGTNSLVNYGYGASDLPVHNYWINGMSQNKVFIAGVYPHGFHCIIYYLHEVFGIDTYILLRLFTLTSVLYIHLALFATIKGLTKSRYSSYAAVIIYVVVDYLNSGCYSRYIADLPQEYGMIFIMPTIYFLIQFFFYEKENTKSLKWDKVDYNTKKIWNKIRYQFRYRNMYDMYGRESLFFAALSFSLTIAIHFYGTFIAGLFCIAIVAAFFDRFIRPRYMLKLMTAFIIGVLIAVLPMAVSIMQGNKMQGSIGWGLNIINSSKSDTTGQDNNVNNNINNSSSNNTQQNTNNGQNPVQGDNTDTTNINNGTESTKPSKSFGEKVVDLCFRAFQALVSGVDSYVVNKYALVYVILMLAGSLLMILFGIGLKLAKQYIYGSSYITIVIGNLLIHVMFISPIFGLPALMDQSRCRIYMMYCMTAFAGMFLDIVTGIIHDIIKDSRVHNIFSLERGVIVCIVLIVIFGIRPPARISEGMTLERNGAIQCLYNIMKEHEDGTWTIVSANDEFRMIDDRGWHVEIYEFLKKQKRANRYNIPTKYVYFFVEKKPVDYMKEHDKSGSMVSRQHASEYLPDAASGISIYTDGLRLMIMSKMYYWANEYMRLYPNDFTIYYEDNEFICYKLIQNTSNLNNLIIDYGYNE